jgi:hypothetical protein
VELPALISNLVQYIPLPEKKVSQRWLLNKTEYTFGEDKLAFLIATGSSTQSFNVPYDSINLENVTYFEERNAWLRNVGLLWILLGAIFIIMKLGSGPLWLNLGILCVTLHFCSRTKYSLIPAAECNILVLRDKKHDSIMDALRDYRKNHFRKYIQIIPALSPRENLERLSWFNQQGAVTPEEFSAITKALEAEMAISNTDDGTEAGSPESISNHKLN